MRIQRLAATFGRLENDILELSPGLNVIQAPNEGGKSTWTAFLRVMLYGLNTRDRSDTADKRRYLPWSGSAMAGAMDLAAGAGSITLTRRTARASAPMGAFSAVYAGTASPVPGLDGANCGEVLLGVPQEVYVRSAFIRQSGMAVDQDSALERRVAALLSTGEEDVSYSDVEARLRRQLNARRSNRATGQLPQLERELRDLDAALSGLDTLSASLSQSEAERAEIQGQIESLQARLALHDEADRYDARLSARAVRHRYEAAHASAAGLARAAATYPAKADLLACQADLRSLDRQAHLVDGARRDAGDAASRLEDARAALRAHPFADRTPEEAARLPLDAPPPPKLSPLAGLLPLLAGAAAVVTAGVVLMYAKLPPAAAWLAALTVFLVVFAIPFGAALMNLRARRRRWEAGLAALKQGREAGLAAYTILYKNMTDAQSASQGASAALHAAEAAFRSAEADLLARVRAFCPTAAGLAAAPDAINAGLTAWERLEAAQAAEADARRELDRLPPDMEGPLPAAPPVRPSEDRAALQRSLAAAQDRLRDLERVIHTAQGRLESAGDRAELTAAVAEKAARRDALQAEYDAIALAMEVLSSANSALQTRFSPALGKRAAEIFARLTAGKYDRVLLDRDMTPSAQAADQLLPHAAAFLSQGAADQLYLAVRLAICDLVLPPEKAPPIVLDDALVTFDDRRMAAALDCLTELSGACQILLFTCQRREAAYLRSAHPNRFHFISL